jgi:hypothetical protein
MVKETISRYCSLKVAYSKQECILYAATAAGELRLAAGHTLLEYKVIDHEQIKVFFSRWRLPNVVNKKNERQIPISYSMSLYIPAVEGLY